MIVWESTWHGESKFPVDFQLNWCGVTRCQLTEELFLANGWWVHLRLLMYNVPVTTLIETYLQHEAAPPHMSQYAPRYLNSYSPCHRIGRGGLLTRMSAYMKNSVYERKVNTREGLICHHHRGHKHQCPGHPSRIDNITAELQSHHFRKRWPVVYG